MKNIKAYIENKYNDIITKAGLKNIFFEQSESFGGNAILIYQNKDIKLRFVQDKSQLFLDFSGIRRSGDKWFSIGLIRHYLLKENFFLDLMTEDNDAFLNKNFEDIVQMFVNVNLSSTEKALQKQALIRLRSN